MNVDGSRSPVRMVLRIAGAVVLVGAAVTFVAMCFFGITMVACSYAGASTEKVFDTIHIGDTKDSVIATMGKPDHIETPDALYKLNFTGAKCQGACTERLWYHRRICLDEAWAVELDQHNKVIKAGHIVSP